MLHMITCASPFRICAGPFAGIYAVWRCTCVNSKSDVPTWILVVGGAGIVLVRERAAGGGQPLQAHPRAHANSAVQPLCSRLHL